MAGPHVYNEKLMKLCPRRDFDRNANLRGPGAENMFLHSKRSLQNLFDITNLGFQNGFFEVHRFNFIHTLVFRLLIETQLITSHLNLL